MREYNTMDDFNFENKNVLLRVDFNMPLDKETLDIIDDTRIRKVLPTINELISKKAKTVIMAHQGRKGDWDFTNLEKHAEVLSKLLKKKVTFVDDLYGEKAKAAIRAMKPGDVIMLDNVRNFDGETEKKTPEEHAGSELVKNLYPLFDYFINDAFAAAHRKHCSIVGFTYVLPSCAGRLMEKELNALEKVTLNPDKPSVFLFGGAKFSDVIVTIDRLLSKGIADRVILTGLPANAFLKAKGYELGSKTEESLSEEGTPESYAEIKKILEKYNNKISLPVDFAYQANNKREEIDLSGLPIEENLFDIGSKSIEKFKEILKDAKTVFISGPCGVFENKLFMKGTEEIFRFISQLDAFSIAGGGHTVAAIEKLGIADKISHISTGGGALEKFMMGEKLPGIEALKESKKRFSNLLVKER